MKPEEITKCPHRKGEKKHKHHKAGQMFFTRNLVFVITTSGSIFYNVLNLSLGENPPPWKEYEGPWECVLSEGGEIIE